jgi:predicted 2-oxoglutarate/Fe(II)-dependent dioxygenase YbiX
MPSHWAISFRADLSGILLLSEEHDYDEGELEIQDMHSARRIKLTARTPCFTGGKLVGQRILLQFDASIQGLGAPRICMP